MGVEIVIGLGLLAIVGVLVATGVGVLWGFVRQASGRADLATAIDTGALPPSLHPRIDPARCVGSGSCVAVCPEQDVLAVLDGVAHVVNPTSCIGHGECLRACPVDAISLVLGHEQRGVDIPLVDRDFQTNVPGIHVVGELGGMGLIVNAMTQALQCMDALVKSAPPRVDGAHQVLIVGAGPAGMAASLAAKAAGLDFVTVDQESVGGTVLQYPRQKLVMTRPVTLPLYGRVRIGEIRKEELLGIWEDILAKTGLEIRTGVRVDGISRGADGLFDVRLDGGSLRAQRVVLAMGRRGTPRKLGVPGEDLPKVTYRLLEPERYAGQRVLVVGGGDSALEAAVALAESGAEVALSYRGEDFSRAKKKNREKVESAIKTGKVAFLAKSGVTAITADDVALEVDGAERRMPNDYVLVFAGGLLPTKFLTDAGVEVESYRGQVYAPAN